MRILIAADHYPVASGRYVRDALRRLGHEVRSAGKPMGTEIWGLSLPRCYIWTPDYTDDFVPDLLLVMDSNPAVLDEFMHFPAPLKAVYGVDNHVRPYRKGYDHYFLAHHHGPAHPVDDADPDTTWLPCGFDPEVFRPSGIPWAKRSFDVCCLGVQYPRRRRMVDVLRSAHMTVLAGTGLVFENMARSLQESRISLCVSAASDLAQRIFESAACGCALLTDPLLDLADPKTKAHLDFGPYVIFDSDDDLVEKARATLRINREVPDWADTAPASILRHTWDERAKVIIAWATRRIRT